MFHLQYVPRRIQQNHFISRSLSIRLVRNNIKRCRPFAPWCTDDSHNNLAKISWVWVTALNFWITIFMVIQSHIQILPNNDNYDDSIKDKNMKKVLSVFLLHTIFVICGLAIRYPQGIWDRGYAHNTFVGDRYRFLRQLSVLILKQPVGHTCHGQFYIRSFVIALNSIQNDNIE